jgi:fibronectin type 3 domain-containing protein
MTSATSSLYPPQHLTLIPKSNKISLVWDPIKNASSYNVYRYTSNYQFWLPPFDDISQFTKIGCIKQAATFIDAPLPAASDQVYYYGVTAIDNKGKESEMSDYSSILIPKYTL